MGKPRCDTQRSLPVGLSATARATTAADTHLTQDDLQSRSPCPWHPRPLAGRLRRAALAILAVAAIAVPAIPQYDLSDEPLLASTISELDIEMRGRWVRQWKQEDGTSVLMFNGGFRLDMGRRRFSANNAVVWVASGRSEDTPPRQFQELTVYLSENAEVREPGDTYTSDHVLLVRGLRTFGQVIKFHDAHLPESGEESSLYQQALRDRTLIESATTEPSEVPGEVLHPAELRRPKVERPPRVIRYRLPKVESAQTRSGDAVFVSSGGVYFSQDGGPDAPMLEIRADTAVVFPAQGATAGSLFGTDLEGEQRSEPKGEEPAGAPREARFRASPNRRPNPAICR